MGKIVTTEPDQFIKDRYETQTRWVATLNNGEKVFQDDDRPGVKPNSAWLRLGRYCQKNQLYIQKLVFQFRSNVITVGEDVDGFFFSKVVLGAINSEKNTHFYLGGTLEGGIIYVRRWKIPELLEVKSERHERLPEEVGEALITKYGKEVHFENVRE